MSMPQTIPDAASPEIPMNENFASQAWTFCYSNDPRVNDGLHRGYSGGRWGTFTVTDVDHTFGASVTTYVSVHLTDGALDFSTSSTNYNDTTNYKKVETVVTGASAVTSVTDDRGGPGGAHGGGASAGAGSSGIPQNSQSTGYTLVLGDANGHMLHPSADTTARTFTIPANSSVAFPIGTAVTFVNQHSAGILTIAITTDTMRLSSGGTTGSRSLAADGIATALKITSTEWIISGSGLT